MQEARRKGPPFTHRLYHPRVWKNYPIIDRSAYAVSEQKDEQAPVRGQVIPM